MLNPSPALVVLCEMQQWSTLQREMRCRDLPMCRSTRWKVTWWTCEDFVASQNYRKLSIALSSSQMSVFWSSVGRDGAGTPPEVRKKGG